MKDGSKTKVLNYSNSASTPITDKIKSIKYSNSSSLTWKGKLRLFLENKYFKIYACVITLIVLLLSDIQQIGSSQESDLAFDIIYILLAFIIFIEIIIYFITDETYGFSLPFFIDIMFFISIMFDVSKIYDSIIYREHGTNIVTNMDRIPFIKIARFVKNLRIIRIWKIVTMFNHSILKRDEDKGNISSTFIDSSSYKIIVFYSLLILGYLLFDPDLYMENPMYDKAYTLQLFSDLNFLRKNIYSSLLLFDSYINYLYNSKATLIFAQFDKIMFLNDSITGKIRKKDRLIYYKESKNDSFNITPNEETEYDNVIKDYINKKFFSNYSNNYDELYTILNNTIQDKNNNTYLLFTELIKDEIL